MIFLYLCKKQNMLIVHIAVKYPMCTSLQYISLQTLKRQCFASIIDIFVHVVNKGQIKWNHIKVCEGISPQEWCKKQCLFCTNFTQMYVAYVLLGRFTYQIMKSNLYPGCECFNKNPLRIFTCTPYAHSHACISPCILKTACHRMYLTWYKLKNR